MRKFEFDKKLKKDLNVYEIVIYNELYSYANIKKNIYEVYPNILTIAKELRINKNTVSKYIKSLADKGYIDIFKRKALAGNKNIYKLKVIWNNIKKGVSNFVKSSLKPFKKGNTGEDKTNNTFDELEDFNGYEEAPNSEFITKKENLVDDDLAKLNEAEQEDLKGKLIITKALINPYHIINDRFIADLNKVSYLDFHKLTEEIFDKVLSDGKPISIKYLHNRLKREIQNNKYM